MHRERRQWVLVALAIACGPAPTPADFMATSARLFCQSDCFAASAAYVVSGCSSTEAYDAYSLQTLASIDAGRTRFDARLAEKCLQQLNARNNCDPEPAECWSIFQGTLAAGESCTVGTECRSGSCSGSTCPRTCQPAGVVPGAPCPCDESYPLTCRNGVCAALGARGDACSADGDCEFIFVCREGTCTTRSAGDACSPKKPCGPGSGLYCDSGTCRQRLAAGSSCVWNENVLIGVPVGTADAVGFGVDTHSESNSCAEGLTCIGGGASATQAGTCGPLSEAGGPCVVTTDRGTVITGCRLGLLCVSGRCEVPPSSGDCLQSTCDVRVSFCDSTGHCVPYLSDGSLCGAGYGFCASGNCVGGNDMFPGRCEPAGACASN